MTQEAVQELDLHLLDKPAKRSAKDGLSWVREAWRLFKQRWGTWLMMLLVYLLISSVVPGILMGFLAAAMPQFKPIFDLLASGLQTVLLALLTGGILISAASLAEEDDLKFSYLFSGFQYQLKPLLVLSAVFVVLPLLLGAVMGLLGMEEALSPENLAKGGVPWSLLLPLLLLVVLMSGMGTFSTALVVLHDVAPLKAIGMSLKAFFRNWSAFLVLMLVWIGLSLGVGLTIGFLGGLLSVILGKLAGVGVLLAVPFILMILAVGVLQLYTAYRNVWTNLPME